jgi:hypothetical protein
MEFIVIPFFFNFFAASNPAFDPSLHFVCHLIKNAGRQTPKLKLLHNDALILLVHAYKKFSFTDDTPTSTSRSADRYLEQDRRCTYNTVARSRNRCCREQAMSITYSEFVFGALGIQHAVRMRRNKLSSVAVPSPQTFFLLYLINGTIFEKRY